MAYIANTAFEPKVTNRVFDAIANITGIYNGGTPYEACSAGFLCKKDTLLALEGYSSGNNSNSWNMVPALSTDLNSEIYACNYYGVNEITDPVTGATYKMGPNTLGIPCPAKTLCTFTRIDFHGNGHYRFGAGNLSAAISTNTYFTIDNGLLVPAASAPTTTGTPYFKMLGSGKFTQGAYSSFTYYDVEAHIVEA